VAPGETSGVAMAALDQVGAKRGVREERADALFVALASERSEECGVAGDFGKAGDG